MLSNFVFKVNTKIIADWLALVASQIITANQSGFIRGRHIEDCMAAASKCLNMLNNRCFGGNIAVKITCERRLIRWIESLFFQCCVLLGFL